MHSEASLAKKRVHPIRVSRAVLPLDFLALASRAVPPHGHSRLSRQELAKCAECESAFVARRRATVIPLASVISPAPISARAEIARRQGRKGQLVASERLLR